MAQAADDPVRYYDGLMPVNENTPPIVVDNDHYGHYLATFDGQKVAIQVPCNSEKEAASSEAIQAIGPPPLPAAGTICGLRRRKFYIILAVVAVLLIGAIAGLAGGLTARRNSSSGNVTVDSPETLPSPDANPSRTSSAAPTSSATPSAAPIQAIHDNSQLATCRSGNSTVSARHVTYQDPIGSLMLATWDSNNMVWASVNISDRMLEATTPVWPKLGTPLACVTGVYTEVHVLFLDKDNVVREVYTKDDGQYRVWKQGALYTDIRIAAQPQSRLAAYWLGCVPKCPSSEDGHVQVRIFFEDEPGSLASYLGATWARATNFTATGRVGSGLATTPYYRSDADVTRMMFFFDTGEKLGMMTRNYDEANWAFDQSYAGETHPTFPGQQIAATKVQVAPLDEKPVKDSAILAVQLEQDGGLAATYWHPRADSSGNTGKWTFGRPVELVGGPQPPPAFKTIAMNMDAKFYGIADAAILEYTIDNQNLTRFTFTKTVVA
ncbi:hypothetical protein B0I37DRAFT_370173 [Chaetomium sp. MPI-CAGE-AT-0009]|nr:hypothetical protein B0I37DRAFT_370173 [Chaetomium sp. MPI-CAGE-AT-0009]